MKLRIQNNRGVTIVEVLTSIIVAVIGVAGVLILIPFGIRQARVGLELDTSTSVADNAQARFEIEGYAQVVACDGNECLPWMDATVDPTIATPTLINKNSNLTSCYWIDPLSPANFDPAAFVATDGMGTNNNFFLPVGAANANAFILGDANSLDGNTGINVSYQPQFVQMLDLVNPFTFVMPPPTPPLLPVQPNVVNVSVLRRMFVSEDDLQFTLETDQSGNAINDLAPPQPIFDVDPSRTDMVDNDGDGDVDELDELAINRQSSAAITWTAVAVPRRNLGAVDLNSVEGFDFYIFIYNERDFTKQLRFTQVINPPLPRLPITQINGTGTIFVSANVRDEVVSPQDFVVNNGDWVMLITFVGTPNPQPKVGFFRVIGTDENSNAITVDGLEFPVDLGAQQTVFAVALPDVVNVYKRQLNLEASSSFIHQ